MLNFSSVNVHARCSAQAFATLKSVFNLFSETSKLGPLEDTAVESSAKIYSWLGSKDLRDVVTKTLEKRIEPQLCLAEYPIS